MRGHERRIIRAQLGMQADIADARIAEQWREWLDADRARVVPGKVAAAGPDEADPQAVKAGKLLAPFCGALRVWI